jgi:excisionase family DNA binding protein
VPRQVHLIPPLTDLFQSLEQAFSHHVEIERNGSRALLLRMAGREFKLAGLDEAPAALVQDVCENLAEVAAFGLATRLTDESAAGSRLRIELIAALAAIEATTGKARERQAAEEPDEFLTTAEAAQQLGMSRPYVSMLCNQGKLGEVGRSEGGHRRIRQSAVEAYRRAHLAAGEDAPRTRTTPKERN